MNWMMALRIPCRRRRPRAALAAVLLMAFPWATAQVMVDKEVVEPRTFGYVVGDTIRRELHLSLHSGYAIDGNSLPEEGRLDRWLELAPPELSSEPAEYGRRFRLVLNYQLFNAPLGLETITIPQQNLRIVDAATGRQGVSTFLPALRINVAPLVAAASAERLSGSSLQQDRPPAPLDTRTRQERLAWLAAALFALLLAVAWRRMRAAVVARGGQPFARAVRKLKKSHAPADDAARLKIVHEAINETAGRAVFAHNLERFFATHGRYAAVRQDFEQLFAASGKVFFTRSPTEPSPAAVPDLLELCRRCRRIERRSAGARKPGQDDATRV